MRKRVILIIVISACCMGVFLFWDLSVLSMEKFSDLATAAAAIAAAWSAYEARKSVGAAARTADIAEKTLRDTRESARYNRFQQEFTLMLAQHNQYHAELTRFMDSSEGENLTQKVLGGGFSISTAANTLYMDGRVSPYMRVLYHLLKLIDTDFYGGNDDLKGRKKYSSLVRSLIRNDVLMLLAVNVCRPAENYRGLHGDFVYYHRLLNKFDFFEHADFKALNIENGKSKYSIASMYDIFERAYLMPVKHDIIKCLFLQEVEWNKINLSSPEESAKILLSINFVFDNPTQKTLVDLINSSEENLSCWLNSYVHDKNEEADSTFRKLRISADELITEDGMIIRLSEFTESAVDCKKLGSLLHDSPTEGIKFKKNGGVYLLSPDLKNTLKMYLKDYDVKALYQAPDREARYDKMIRYGMNRLGRRLDYLIRLRSDSLPPSGLKVKTFPVDG